MDTLFTISPDGARIAYDRSGAGPAIVLLLHGGGSNRVFPVMLAIVHSQGS